MEDTTTRWIQNCTNSNVIYDVAEEKEGSHELLYILTSIFKSHTWDHDIKIKHTGMAYI